MGNAKHESGEPVCQHGSPARCCNVCELEAEVERLREQSAGWAEAFRNAESECGRMRKAMEDWHDIAVLQEREADRLREDARRYRWLKSRIKRSYGLWFVEIPMGREGPTEVDAAIDYAIKGGA